MILSKKLKYVLTPSLWKFHDRSQVPSKKVQFEFRLRYPNAKQMQWKKMDFFKWQVSFRSRGIAYWSLYTNDCIWLETTQAVSLKDIPKRIQENFESKYGDKGLQHIYKIQTSLRTIFEVQRGNGLYNHQLLYDDKGRMLGKMIGKD